MQADTTWFRNAKWGVFIHYLAEEILHDDGLSAENWNAVIDAFDVEGLARQLHQVGAGYFMLTTGQCSGYYCAPNAAYDSFVGTRPSKCSRRDLIADMYKALKPYGIPLLVYMPSDAPQNDSVAVQKLKWQRGAEPDHQKPVHGLNAKGLPWGQCNPPNLEFQAMWEMILREWSLRWGRNIRGWWFDGCYFADAMYRRPETPNFASFAAAAKAGNPDSLVAFNAGVHTPVIRVTEYEDYTAGEIDKALPVYCAYPWHDTVKNGKVDGAQYHFMTHMGPVWNASPPRFDAELVAAYSCHIVNQGGVITWDVPPTKQGRIPDDFLQRLEYLGKHV